MTTQTISKINFSCSLFNWASLSQTITQNPISVNPADYGFDFDENELPCELSPLPARISCQDFPQVAAEDFESTFQWFIS